MFLLTAMIQLCVIRLHVKSSGAQNVPVSFHSSLFKEKKASANENSDTPGQSPEGGGMSKCDICLDNLEEKGELSCCPGGHVFHDSCFQPWLKVKKDCPLCREKVTKAIWKVFLS